VSKLLQRPAGEFRIWSHYAQSKRTVPRCRWQNGMVVPGTRCGATRRL